MSLPGPVQEVALDRNRLYGRSVPSASGRSLLVAAVAQAIEKKFDRIT